MGIKLSQDTLMWTMSERHLRGILNDRLESTERIVSTIIWLSIVNEMIALLRGGRLGLLIDASDILMDILVGKLL